MDLPFSAYKGDQPYVFVCYAHADKDLVYPLMRWLHEQGVNVWYDEGLSPGEEWTEELGHAIERADRFIYFVTPASVASRNCRNEVHFAQKHGKAMLAAHLQDTQLPSGLELTIGTNQAILKSQMTEVVFRGKLLAALKSAASQARPLPAATKRRGSSTAIVAAIAVFIVAAGAGWWWLSKSDPPLPETFDRSVTVRPFVADSGNAALESFAQGLRNELSGILAGYPELRTVAENQVQTAASRRATYAVEGHAQAAGTGATIRVDLVRTPDGETVWSERFEPKLPEGIADESALATRIARFIRLQLVQDHQCQRIRQKTSVAEAADATCAALAENYRANQGGAVDLELLRALSERAIALDPGLADAHVHLAIALLATSLVMPEAIPREEARQRAGDAIARAFSIEPSPMAYFMRAMLAVVTLEYADAEADLREAIRRYPLDPNARWFHGALGVIAMRRGDINEALTHYRRAIKVYDADARIYYEYAHALFCAGDLKDAIDAAKRGLELTTTGYSHLSLLATLTRAYVALGEPVLANETVDRALSTVEPRSAVVPLLAWVGRLDEARRLPWDASNPDVAVLAYTALRENDRAIDSWHQAIDARSGFLSSIRTDPAFAELRKDPRWPEVMRHLERVENEGH